MNCYYTWISNANYILDAEELWQGQKRSQSISWGQACVIRGLLYFMLAQVLPGPIKDMRVNLVALYMSSRQSPVQKENHVHSAETYAPRP